MPTIEQIRAARALLDWSQSDLADHAGLSQTGIARIENGTNQPNSATLAKIEKAFEEAGIEFIGKAGLQRRTNEVITMNGAEGLKALVDDIYETAKAIKDKTGSSDDVVYLYNAKPRNWHKWLGKEWWDMHAGRMTALGSKVQRIVTSEGDDYFISGDFSQHKAIPMKLFNDQSIYAYGSKLAFVNFGETITVNILGNKEFCDGFRVLFDIAWEHVAKPVSK